MSIVSGYAYDIFISYRHNDNRSGWVTEFVKALQEELASTIKEPISVYFDTNPHDGLLETHDVDKSLEGKLKCLIFIPIISQTYCDPKSFAWQNEFLAFNKLAKNDPLGRDVRLKSGNVASRILPIKIHDLDTGDTVTIENEIEGVLRAIEFIFKAPGVNRPLRSQDDDLKEITHTLFYRDQVNKVANAVKEILVAIKSPVAASQALQNVQNKLQKTKRPFFSKLGAVSIGVAVITLFAFFYFFSHPSSGDHDSKENDIDKSVAVLAFTDMSPNKDQEWFSDALTEDILNSLANLKELKVTARTSSFYFKDKNASVKEIAEKLGVAHVVEGSVQRIDNQLRITVQLIRAKDEVHIWSKKYDRTAEDLFKVQTDIAENIAKELLRELTPEKKLQLVSSKPTNTEVYEYYLKGVNAHIQEYLSKGLPIYFEESERYFLKAISLEPTYAEAYGALSNLYDTRAYKSTDDLTKSKYAGLRDSVFKIGYTLNPNSPEVLITYFELLWTKDKIDSAFYCLKKAHHIAPGNAMLNWTLGRFYFITGLPELGSDFVGKAVEFDPLSIVYLKDMLKYQAHLGNFDIAKQTAEKIIHLNGNDAEAHAALFRISLIKNNRQDAMMHANYLEQIDPDIWGKWLQPYLLFMEGKKPDGKINSLTILSLLKMKKEFFQLLNEQMAANKDCNPCFVNVVWSLQYFDFVRDEPELKIILDRVKKNQDALMAKYGNLD